VAKLRERRAVRLVILGEGPEEARLRSLAAELGMAEDLRLPGFVENPYAYMARAGVFVLSSAWEGFGNVVAEALACGCPVVSTDCPSGPGEMLAGGRYGRLVPVGQAEVMAAAIDAALDDPGDPAARKARAAEFSVDAAVRRYLALFDGLCDAQAVEQPPSTPAR
jgi:glycosyltransferase involved in cell wall biosynthesis